MTAYTGICRNREIKIGKKNYCYGTHCRLNQVINNPVEVKKEVTIKKEKEQGVRLVLDAPTVGRKRKRPPMGSPEKVIKKEKVDAPPKGKLGAGMISKDSVKGHLSLIRKYLFDARR